VVSRHFDIFRDNFLLTFSTGEMKRGEWGSVDKKWIGPAEFKSLKPKYIPRINSFALRFLFFKHIVTFFFNIS